LKCSEAETAIRKIISEQEIYMREAEMQVLDTDHAEVGAWLSKSWFLPDKLSEPISFHHDVIKSENHRIKTSVVHIADVLIKASGFGHSGDCYVPQIQKVAWDTLKMSEQILAEIVEEIEDKLVEVKNFSLEIQA
jgi:HD-like signal output (HDOD) protein